VTFAETFGRICPSHMSQESMGDRFVFIDVTCEYLGVFVSSHGINPLRAISLQECRLSRTGRAGQANEVELQVLFGSA
jgi:hypothetical protein